MCLTMIATLYNVVFASTEPPPRRGDTDDWDFSGLPEDLQWLRSSGPFETREAAQAYLRDGFKITSVPHVSEGNLSGQVRIYDIRPAPWFERENHRFATGVYKRVPWWQENWWRGTVPAYSHYAHISTEDPTKIAFTASEEHGKADRQTRMKPGKYLNKFFGDVLTPKQIEYLATWFRTGQKPTEEYEGEFRLATTPDEIEEVYEANISSCMEGESAVRVYGAGDLAVAHWDVDDEPVARALCWPEKEVFGRIYPEPGDYRWGNALLQAFRQKGWKHVNETNYGFNGAKLLKLEAGTDYVMPYIDLGYGVDDAGDHFVMNSRDPTYDANETTGYLELAYATCERCGGTENPDDTYSVHTSVREFNGRLYGSGEETWCSRCADHHSFYCEATDSTYDDDVPTVDFDGDRVVRAWAENEVAQGRAYQNPDVEYEFSTTPYETDEEPEADETIPEAA